MLFLLRKGDGERALAEKAPSLSSWVRGSDADPEALAEINVPRERQRFQDQSGMTPESWLNGWRSGATPRSGQTYSLAYWAMLLERP